MLRIKDHERKLEARWQVALKHSQETLAKFTAEISSLKNICSGVSQPKPVTKGNGNDGSQASVKRYRKDRGKHK
jgi:hypothetical protein